MSKNIFFICMALLGGIAMACGQWMIFFYAPLEMTMREAQKIFYIHLPVAWWGLISFGVVFVASIAFLKTRQNKWDNLAWAAAEIGVILSALALISGSVWARHSWGVWWTWDPRLTTTLIMWFVYMAYLILRKQEMAPERRAAICSILGIVAFLDVPLVFISARMWRSIHPAVFASKDGGLELEMLVTVIFCILSFGLLWAALLYLRTALIATERKIDALAQDSMKGY
jgi:heme exporter protein C